MEDNTQKLTYKQLEERLALIQHYSDKFSSDIVDRNCAMRGLMYKHSRIERLANNVVLAVENLKEELDKPTLEADRINEIIKNLW